MVSKLLINHLILSVAELVIWLLFITMGRDYFPELRPETGLLFILQFIYEKGEPRWNDIDSGKLLIRQPEAPGNSTSSHLVAKWEEHADGNAEFCPWSISFILVGFFTCHKILRYGADGFTSPPKLGVLRIFIALKHPIVLCRLRTREPWSLESNGKHCYRYTTEGD
jgi:hypothetical protein